MAQLYHLPLPNAQQNAAPADTGVIECRAIKAAMAELAAVSALVEENTVSVSERFTAIARDSERQTGDIEALIQDSDTIDCGGEHIPLTEVASGLKSSLTDLVSKILFLSSRGMQMVYALEDVLGEMRAVNASISMIDKINNQTNLLALNAKIEAAHAGEAGKGFSVVANEVRELATNTNRISMELRERITKVTGDLNNSFDIIKEISTLDMSEENVLANERANLIVTALVGQHRRFSKALGDASSRNARFVEDLNAAVVRMQFQDRAKQKIENVCAMLSALMESRLTQQHDARALTESLTEVLSLGDMKARVLAVLEDRPLEEADTPEAIEDIELF